MARRRQNPVQALLRREMAEATRVRKRRLEHGSHAPRIVLVSHIGARSGPALVRHFLDHYYRLGVDDFLIILHGSRGDAQSVAIERELARYNQAPALWVDSFSCLLKRARYQKVVDAHCRPRDWVIYADVDELQIYPAALHDFVGKLALSGLDYATGHFVDHLADNGVLAPIHPELSIWEQFPYVGLVTEELTGGATRKVCIARARRRLGDGGAHTLAGPGDYHDNWRRTHAGAWSEPSIQIHHFKWDASLPERLDNKLQGLAGDRDRVDGSAFMGEYRRLAAHLGGGSVVHVAALRLFGRPKLAEERAPLGAAHGPSEPTPVVARATPELRTGNRGGKSPWACRRLW